MVRVDRASQKGFWADTRRLHRASVISSARVFVSAGRADLHLGAFVQAVRSAGDHHVRGGEPARHLHVGAIVDAQRDRLFMRRAV